MAGPVVAGTTLPPGQQFGPRYTIIRLLGSGGMASVYQAWDETLGTAVALKLIRVDASTPRAELRALEDRFKRELKLARQVTHPNVVRIHDLGEVESTLYLTMEYVQGADLATLLKREPQLPLPRLLLLARQIAAGLAAAHKAGIVHRDLKPANVMVVEAQDHALLMDFGIARSTTAATINTMPGALIGTLDYMAPEQARGEPTDERTDVYAFGLILYELLAGGRPRYSAEGGLSALIQRLEKGPPPLKSLQPNVPPALERIVTKCLQPAAADRYASAAEVLAELETLDDQGRARVAPPVRPAWQRLAALLIVGAVLIGATWWLSRGGGPAAPPPARAAVPILIVDFQNRAHEPVFDGALEQSLSIAMEGAPFITAFPRADAATMVRDLKLGKALDEESGRLLARREGIPVILAGMIERSGNGYRVAVRRLAPDKPEALSESAATAADKSQVLGAVTRIAEDLREALGDTPSSAQQGETFTAGSLEAMQAYTIAQDLSTSQRDAEAAEKYREALRHDPEFGRAYSGLGASLYRLGNRDEAEKNWNEAMRRADRMTEREKLRTSGGYYIAIARNTDKAIETYEQLVAKYPADSAGYNNLAIAHFATLNFAKAFEYGRKAIEIYPKTYKYRSNYALYAMYAGDFKTAQETAQELIKEDPKVDVPYLPLAMAAVAAGDIPRARDAYEQVRQAGHSGLSLSALGIADIAMYQGRHDEAISILPAAVASDKNQQNIIGAAAKLVALAEAYHARGNDPGRQAAITQARALSTQENVLVPLARLFIDAGRPEEAQ
jgi:tetratricopeptide (TPR) repeat protein/tRNA A-37 threonylcarbamoyl transferase component Bud32